MIIDGHAHIVPPALLEEVRDRADEFPSVEVARKDGSVTFAFAGHAPTRPVSPKLSDIAGRLSWMDGQGIDRQVVGGWLDMFGNEMPAAEGARWAETINAALLTLAAQEDRFVPLATVPLQSGAEAARVLRAAHGAGFRGAMIGTQPKGRGGVLDDPDLDPFWQAAHDLKMAIFVHPVFESGDPRVKDYGMANAVGRVTDTLIAMSRLIYAGHVQRFSDAAIVAGVGGAALPYVIGRLRRNHVLHPDATADPDAALRGLYYDTIVQDEGALRLLVDCVGADRLMMGSDMPFPIGDLEPAGLIERHGFTEAEHASVMGGLVARLLNL